MAGVTDPATTTNPASSPAGKGKGKATAADDSMDIDEDDDDDDLPDPLDILRTMPSKQESSDDYSDSELDALMLKIPSDEIPSSSAPPVRGSSSKKRLSTPISRNNVKRAKVEGSSSSPGPHRNKVTSPRAPYP